MAACPSGFPREKANPALVVASALKPRLSKIFADPASQQFGTTKIPSLWCSARNSSAFACNIFSADLLILK
jgi:hypothetical protein